MHWCTSPSGSIRHTPHSNSAAISDYSVCACVSTNATFATRARFREGRYTRDEQGRIVEFNKRDSANSHPGGRVMTCRCRLSASVSRSSSSRGSTSSTAKPGCTSASARRTKKLKLHGLVGLGLRVRTRARGLVLLQVLGLGIGIGYRSQKPE